MLFVVKMVNSARVEIITKYTVRVYDLKEKILDSIKTKLEITPRDLAVTQNDDLVSTDLK